MWFWRGIILILSNSITESFYPNKFFEQLFTMNIGPIQIQFVWSLPSPWLAGSSSNATPSGTTSSASEATRKPLPRWA